MSRPRVRVPLPAPKGADKTLHLFCFVFSEINLYGEFEMFRFAAFFVAKTISRYCADIKYVIITLQICNNQKKDKKYLDKQTKML